MQAVTAHILVTGASRGIGAAIAENLTARGARVCGHARTDQGAFLGEDLATDGAAGRLWTRALAALDCRIDVVINNAGVYEPAPLDMDDTAWAAAGLRDWTINLRASAELSRHAVRNWRARAMGGRIINIASRAAWRGDSPDYWHYAASKAGMVAMTRTISRGYAADQILAFAVCPGFVETDMAAEALSSADATRIVGEVPLGRVATAAEVAGAVTYLALDAPPSMTGAALDINGASYVR